MGTAQEAAMQVGRDMNRESTDTGGLLEPLALASVLVVYSNGLAAWAESRGEFPEAVFRRVNPMLIGVMLAYAAHMYGSVRAVGLTRRGLLKSALAGVGAGLALSVPPLVFFHKPIVLDTPLEFGPVARMSRREMLEDVLLRVPISIAVLEELAFRGVLYTSMRRRYSVAASTAVSAGAFAAWHLVVTYTSAAQTNMAETARLPAFVRPYTLPLAVLGGMATTGAAGVVFSQIRERTGNLLGPVLAHWIVDGVMISSLWLRANRNVKRET
jgi:membrane protease YdiL (CAAX protease family)